MIKFKHKYALIRIFFFLMLGAKLQIGKFEMNCPMRIVASKWCSNSFLKLVWWVIVAYDHLSEVYKKEWRQIFFLHQ